MDVMEPGGPDPTPAGWSLRAVAATLRVRLAAARRAATRAHPLIGGPEGPSRS